MGSKEEWRTYQEALRAGDRNSAAEAFRRYQEARKAEGKRSSKPILVNLSSKKLPYPNAVPVDKIPDVIKKSPEFFSLMERVSGRRK